MELTKKDYKRINNLGNEGLPGYSLGTPAGVSSTDQQANLMGWMNNLYAHNGNMTPNGVVKGSLPVSPTMGGQYDFANRAASLEVPKNVNVLPNGKQLSTTSPNTESAPKSGANMQQIQTRLSSIPEFGQHIYDSWTNYDSQDDIRARYKDSNVYAGGIGYNVLEHTGEEREDNTFSNILGSTASGASVGSMFGPWGAVIGGVVGLAGSGIGSIFSHNKQKEQERIMAYKINNINNDRTGNALTKSLRLSYAKEHGDSGQQYLYGAKDGKLPGFERGKQYIKPQISETVQYGDVFAKPNAMVSNGEVGEENGVLRKFGEGKDSNDTIPSIVSNNTTIYPNKGKDRFGMDISDYVWKTGDTDGGLYMLQQYQASKSANSPFYAKNGKLPKFKEGGWANAITSGLGGIAALGQYITAAKNKPYRPNTYSENPYEIDALSTLAGLRVNPYPIMQELRNAESRTNRIIDRSGGLSTAQRGLSRLSALYGTQNNIANTLASIQQQNNAYKANYAQAALNAGNASAQRRMAANQWDLDYFSKAHAARLGGMQAGIQNMLAQAQNWYRNDFKRRQFNDTMALYKQEQANTAAANEAMMKYNQQLIDMQKQQYMSEDWWRQYGKQKGWLS